jgi:hypothetical protein
MYQHFVGASVDESTLKSNLLRLVMQNQWVHEAQSTWTGSFRLSSFASSGNVGTVSQDF